MAILGTGKKDRDLWGEMTQCFGVSWELIIPLKLRLERYMAHCFWIEIIPFRPQSLIISRWFSVFTSLFIKQEKLVLVSSQRIRTLVARAKRRFWRSGGYLEFLQYITLVSLPSE